MASHPNKNQRANVLKLCSALLGVLFPSQMSILKLFARFLVFVGSVLSTDPNVNKLRSVGRHRVTKRYVHKYKNVAQKTISTSLP